MKLFYVMGGGSGHLTRVSTFIHQFNIREFRILTNNPLAEKLFQPNQIIAITGQDQRQIIQQVQLKLNELKFEALYVDAFPVGLYGELYDFSHQEVIYLARRLRWHEYSKLVNQPTIQFHQTYCFEELEEDHKRFIEQTSKAVTPITLRYPTPDETKIPASQIPQGKPIWLIVHSFIQEEVEALVAYAKEMAKIEDKNPAFVVLTDQSICDPEVSCYNFYPASHWFPIAQRIFAGGGFNTVNQAIMFKEKLKFIPFPRKYDDQAWRISQFYTS